MTRSASTVNTAAVETALILKNVAVKQMARAQSGNAFNHLYCHASLVWKILDVHVTVLPMVITVQAILLVAMIAVDLMLTPVHVEMRKFTRTVKVEFFQHLTKAVIVLH